MNIRRTSDPDDADWLTLRSEFITEVELQEQKAFLEEFTRGPSSFCGFVASDSGQVLMGFAEVAVFKQFASAEDYPFAVETERAGEDSGSTFAHYHTGRQALVGLSVGTREWFRRERIDGDIEGIFEGGPAPSGVHLIRATPGFVVAAVEVQAGDQINALRVQFAPFDGTLVPPVDRYWSDWIGSHVTNESTTRLAGAATSLVVGFRGTSGLVLNSLSLLTAQPPQ